MLNYTRPAIPMLNYTRPATPMLNYVLPEASTSLTCSLSFIQAVLPVRRAVGFIQAVLPVRRAVDGHIPVTIHHNQPPLAVEAALLVLFTFNVWTA
jgi:hypothetical protein